MYPKSVLKLLLVEDSFRNMKKNDLINCFKDFTIRKKKIKRFLSK